MFSYIIRSKCVKEPITMSFLFMFVVKLKNEFYFS